MDRLEEERLRKQLIQNPHLVALVNLFGAKAVDLAVTEVHGFPACMVNTMPEQQAILRFLQQRRET